MPETTAQLEGRDLLIKVRGILAGTPRLHDQCAWLNPPAGAITVTAAREDARRARRRVRLRRYCGTTGCVAGWAAVFAAPPGSEFIGTWLVTHQPGHLVRDVRIREYAQDAMGLDDGLAAWMFHVDRRRGELIAALDRLIGPPGQVSRG